MTSEQASARIREIFRAADDNAAAREVLRRHGQVLSVGAVTLANTFSPEMIIVSANELGDIDLSILLAEIRDAVRQRAFSVIAEQDQDRRVHPREGRDPLRGDRPCAPGFLFECRGMKGRRWKCRQEASVLSARLESVRRDHTGGEEDEESAIMLTAAVVLALVFTLSACGPKAPKKLTWWTLQQSAMDIQTAQQNAVKDFEKQFNATVEVTSFPYVELRDKMLTAVAGGQGPDLLLLDQIWVAQYAAAKYVIPITDKMQGSGIKAADYFPGAGAREATLARSTPSRSTWACGP